jgi:hypothetical protein
MSGAGRPLTAEMREKMRAGQRRFFERQAAAKASLLAAERQKQNADWNRLAGTEAFVQRCIAVHKRLPGADFSHFAVELRYPDAPLPAKQRLARQLAEITRECQSNLEGYVYSARLKAALAKGINAR